MSRVQLQGCAPDDQQLYSSHLEEELSLPLMASSNAALQFWTMRRQGAKIEMHGQGY